MRGTRVDAFGDRFQAVLNDQTCVATLLRSFEYITDRRQDLDLLSR